MNFVIKTTVAILDIGTSKHQCVTMRTKDLRECLFLKRFLCIKAVVKRFTFQNQVHIGLRIRFYLKILNDNRKCSKCRYSDSYFLKKKKSIYRKSIKVVLNLSKLPVFTSQIPDLQFWLFHILAFSRFVYFTFITYYFLNCKMYPTYAEIKSTLKLVEVSVLLLFGINLAK